MDVKIKFSNNASARLSNAIDARSTSINIPIERMQLFPTITAGEYFMLTVVDGNGNYEIMKCTARNTTTFTVVRAQEGTKAKVFPEGSLIEHRLTAGSLAALISQVMANTVDFGLVRIATESEVVSGTTLGKAPAVITPESLAQYFAAKVKKATTTLHGIARQATVDEVVSGVTYGNPPAFCTPEGVKKAVNTAISGALSSITNRFNQIEKEITSIKGDISNINKEITSIKNTVTNITETFSASVPIGTIIPYVGQMSGVYPMYGGKVNKNWRLCDGTGGTPNLSRRFLRGALNQLTANAGKFEGADNITGKVGEHTLTVDELPEHRHELPFFVSPWVGYNSGGWGGFSSDPDDSYVDRHLQTKLAGGGKSKPHTHDLNVKYKPLSYTVLYLKKIK